jgi:ubiquinone/menaquinone biosynthesis C-methylase UbiE
VPEWREIRLDIDPRVEPDIVASMIDMSDVKADSMDGLWSSHNLEHLYAHDVPLALREFRRVLRAGGVALITTPDLQKTCELVAADKLDEMAYMSPAGPITPLDTLFGYRPSLAAGNLFMAHHFGFTATTLRKALLQAGFGKVKVARSGFNLWAEAIKTASNVRQPVGNSRVAKSGQS